MIDIVKRLEIKEDKLNFLEFVESCIEGDILTDGKNLFLHGGHPRKLFRIFTDEDLEKRSSIPAVVFWNGKTRGSDFSWNGNPYKIEDISAINDFICPVFVEGLPWYSFCRNVYSPVLEKDLDDEWHAMCKTLNICS